VTASTLPALQHAGCGCCGCMRELAGDVAAKLWLLPHADRCELVILRVLGPWAYFGESLERGPHIERLDVGDPLRLYVRGHIGDLGALERNGDKLRYGAHDLVAIAKHLTTRAVG